MAENTDIIKEKLDIVDFIKNYVPLTKAGRNYKGNCPFHKEKSPSFIVSPERQIWHCFGCGSGSDIIGFLMKYENIEFIEALKVLADKAGVSLKSVGTGDQKKYEIFYEINKAAKDFFQANLKKDFAKPAVKYLLERGLTKETIIEFEIGVAGSENDELVRHLTKIGFSVEDIEKAGLSFKTKRGTYWDRFRERIMFPLCNNYGKPVGFTGRLMPGVEKKDVGKYVNSPETPIYNKSRLVYGFYKSKDDIRKKNSVVVVEGQMDVIMSWQDGVKNVIASSGTALTEDHLKTLRRLAENIILFFDNDSAGQMAASRTIDIAKALDFNVSVIDIKGSDQKDAADIVLNKSGELKKIVESAIPAMQYYFSLYKIGKDQEIDQKKKALRFVLSKIKQISSAIEQAHWLSELSRRSGIAENALTNEMERIKEGRVSLTKEEDNGVKLHRSRKDVILTRLLSLCAADKDFLAELEKSKEVLPDIYQKVFDYLSEGSKKDPEENIRGLINLIYLESSLEMESKDLMEQEFKVLISELKNQDLGTQKKELQKRIAEAESQGKGEEVEKLLREYRDLTKVE